MSEIPTSSDAAKLLTHITQARPGHRIIVDAQELSEELTLLRVFQAQRLAITHSDLLANPRYSPATHFFLNDVYSPKDFSQRDADLMQFYQGVRKVLPERAVSILSDVITLSDLTNELDEKLSRVLFDEVGVIDSITPQQYAEGYRICDNYDDRVRQIKMISQIAAAAKGRNIDEQERAPRITRRSQAQ